MVCKPSSKKENPDGKMIFKIYLKYKLPCGLLEIHPSSDSDVDFFKEINVCFLRKNQCVKFKRKK